MKAILAKQPGDVNQLTFVDLPIPQPQENELLIKVHCTACNRADLVQRRGFYPPPPGVTPVLGLEFAGVVEQVGERCQGNWQPGDRVFGILPGGGYAEYVVTPAELAMRIPESLTFIQAAATAEAFLTAYQTLFWIGQLKPDETVLIHAGASGVGSAAIQLAHSVGARVITTVGSERKEAFCQELGADQTINYRNGPFLPSILAATNDQGVELILDFVGAPYFKQNLQALRPDGRMVLIGTLGGAKVESVSLLTILMKRLQILGTTLRSRSVEYKAKLTSDFVNDFLPLFETSKLKPLVDRVFSWEQVKEAHLYMESNQHMGKVVLQVRTSG